jgi:hypothetical protein
MHTSITVAQYEIITCFLTKQKKDNDKLLSFFIVSLKIIDLVIFFRKC